MLQRAWAGEERLAKVWWNIGVPLNIALAATAGGVIRGAQTPSADSPSDQAGALLVVLGMLFAIWAAWAYMAWRCATNVERPAWALVARCILVFNIAWGLIQFGVGLREGQDAWLLGISSFASQGSQSHAQSAQVANAPPSATAPAQPTTPWDNPTAHTTIYLDSNWQAMTPPEGAFAGATYASYNGQREAAMFDSSSTGLTLEQYGSQAVTAMPGFGITGSPISGAIGTHTVWFAEMTGNVQGKSEYARLYVFRGAQGSMWRVFVASMYPVDRGFGGRADALTQAIMASVS